MRPYTALWCTVRLLRRRYWNLLPGTSDKVLKEVNGQVEYRHNYFGLKYNPKQPDRCPSGIGFFTEGGSEQNADGSYTPSTMTWWKFESLEQCIIGYFDFINNSNYASLKGVTDPKTYLDDIKAANYATSHDYVQNVMNVIKKYNLTRFDNKETEVDKIMKINVHAGHNPDGKIACGAVGLIKESTEARAVKNLVIQKLRQLGHTVYDCTVDDGKNQSDVLQKIVTKCNQQTVDLDVSIHFNSGASDLNGNGKTTGTEAYIYSNTSGAKEYAERICSSIASLGYKNRGVKVNSGLYVLKNTKAPAVLVECCFVDDADDVRLYNAETMANAIVKGITGHSVESVGNEPNTKPQDKLYRVQCGAFREKENALALQRKLRLLGFDTIIV